MKTSLPDELLYITGDAIVKEFALALGVLCHLPDGSTADQAKALFVVIYDHSSHWVLIHRCCGHGDTGFTLTAWPKSRFPKRVVADFIQDFGLGSGSVSIIASP